MSLLDFLLVPEGRKVNVFFCWRRYTYCKFKKIYNEEVTEAHTLSLIFLQGS